MDQTRYCAFHRGSGHETNDCITWIKYFEKIVKEGKCDQYVDRPAARPRREADVDAKFEHLGAINNSKKRKIQQTRSVFQVQTIDAVPGPIVGFTKQNAEGEDFPHNDALVISAQLAHTIVHRIMVDNDSSINILQLSIIQKIDLENTIKRKAVVLTGFNELTSIIIGTITLDVTNLLIISSQTFMIISDPSPYTGYWADLG
ncbi:uncharacterized protein LOC126602921 [Malus sylvestris]|uniref:uncharacterized protein LOC126602921 n=1 Tax=Malus sylvestris TaxID=3752 RepID=UPI0021AC3759|nr:uncharacterized protein LOC126602921 [Malus sylvestris]